MITIFFVIDTLEVGGTEQSLLQLVRALPREQYHCVVCSLYPGRTLACSFEAAGATVVSLNLPGKYQFPTAIRKLTMLLSNSSPDLVHTMLFRASQVGRIAAWRCQIPVISSFVNVPYDRSRLQTDAASRGWKLKCLQVMDAATARLVDQFHAVSEFAKTSNSKALRIPCQRVQVIPRGRDPKLFWQRHPPGSQRCSPVVLNVGRLIAQKGQACLIRATKIVLATIPDMRLQIAGSGPLRDSLTELADQLGVAGHVDLLGRCDDIPQRLASADVFAFPSNYEGLPGALIEAMFAGAPIVAADIPQVKELIRHQESGLIVPANDEHALAAAICRVLADPPLAARLGAEARRVAAAHYDIDVVTGSMSRFYQRVLAESQA